MFLRNSQTFTGVLGLMILALGLFTMFFSSPTTEVTGLATGSYQFTSSSEVFAINNGANPAAADGRNVLFTNELDNPILITDIQVECLGVCTGVVILPPAALGNPTDRFRPSFGNVLNGEPESMHLTTGFVWQPGEDLDYFKLGGELVVNLAGVVLSN